jgi:hypothetical protein
MKFADRGMTTMRRPTPLASLRLTSAVRAVDSTLPTGASLPLFREVLTMDQRRRTTEPLRADYRNRNPFKGLPHDFPSGHSRFDIVPAKGYGDLSFDPPIGDNAAAEEGAVSMTLEQRASWRHVMHEALGKLLDTVPPADQEQA